MTVPVVASVMPTNEMPIVAGLPDLVGEAEGAYPVVLANILATPLKMLAPLLAVPLDCRHPKFSRLDWTIQQRC